MRNLNKNIAAFLPVLLILAGCSHTIPASRTKPTPPPQLSTHASAMTLPATPPPESLLPVTFTADLAPIQRAIQAAVPERFTDADHILGSEFRWAFVREAEPQVSIQDGIVTIHASYRGDIESRGSSRGCHLDPLYPVLDGIGHLTLQQEGDNLVFRLTNPKLIMGLKPESDTKCNMFNIPVKDQLQELFNQETVKKQIAEAVDHAGLAIPIHHVWDRLHGPLAVSVVALNTQLCVYGKPSEMTIGKLNGTVHHTTLTGVARETPSALYENVCHKSASPPVNVRSGGAAAQGPYRVLASIPIPYASLSQTLQDKLFHTQVPLDTMLNDTLIIERVIASDASGRALVAVQTSGNLNGTIYYWGTPQFEGGTVLTIPDLQMASESKTALDSIKVGYWQIVDRALREKIRSAAMVDLSPQIGKMRSAMTGQHKIGEMTMDMKVERQQTERAYSTPQALVADIILEGTASATGPVALETGREQPTSSAPSMSPRPPTTM
jgi:Domain of unknown function (DUF4403)